MYQRGGGRQQVHLWIATVLPSTLQRRRNGHASIRRVPTGSRRAIQMTRGLAERHTVSSSPCSSLSRMTPNTRSSTGSFRTFASTRMRPAWVDGKSSATPSSSGRSILLTLYPGGGPQIDIAKTLELRTTAILDDAKDPAARDTTVVTVKGPPVAPRIRAYSNPLDMLLDLWRSSGLPIGGDSLFGHLFPHLPPGMGAGGVVSGGPGVDVISALLSNRIGDVFLKEFRDCLNPDDACYQAVCKTDMTPTKFHYGGFLEDPSVYDITIQNLASEPLLNAVLGEGSGVKKRVHQAGLRLLGVHGSRTDVRQSDRQSARRARCPCA